MFNTILAFIVFGTTTISEFLFHWVSNSQNLVPIDKYIGAFFFFLLFSFIKNSKIKFLALNLILFLSFFQMAHINFYGMPVYPNAVWLMFTQAGEAIGTLKEDFMVLIYPFIFIGISMLINLLAQNKLGPKLKSIPYLHFLFIFYLIYNPARTYFTGNTWGRQPSTQETLGMNVYLSTSYFLGKILPHKLSNSDHANHSLNLVLEKYTPLDHHIILVLGESLSSNHMSLYGYNRETTPYLNSIKDSPDFIYRNGISSGVSTDVAIAMIMNSTYGSYAINDIRTGKSCLFKLAKDQNLATAFFSIQSQQQLRYISNSICPKYIQKYKNLEMIQPGLLDENEADDLKLIHELNNISLNIPGLTVLHQRGSHSPYNKRYPKEAEKFKITGDYQQDRINHYDNTVYYFDKFMQKLIAIVKAQNSPVTILYLSDHGEGLGEEGVWGHAALKMPSIQIPIIGYFHKTESDRELFEKLPFNATQFNFSLYLNNLLGFKSNYSFEVIPKNFVIFGNDLDGFAGYLETNFEDGRLISIHQKN